MSTSFSSSSSTVQSQPQPQNKPAEVVQQQKSTLSSSNTVANKLGKRFFRKKVISTYDYGNRKKNSSPISALSSTSSDPYKNYYRFKFLPKEQPNILQQQQQKQSSANKGLTFLQNFAPFKRASTSGGGDNGSGLLEKKLTRFSSLRRRSDPVSSLGALQLGPGGPNSNAWWTKYLSNSDGEGQQQQMVPNFPASASLSPAFYNAPDYAHNPVTSATFLPGNPGNGLGGVGNSLNILESSGQNGNLPTGGAPSGDTSGLLNFWLSRLYSNALPYVDLALMTAAYVQQAKKAQEEEEERNSLKGRIRSGLSGARNKLYKQVTPAKKFFSKLSTNGNNNSPYSYSYSYDNAAPQIGVNGVGNAGVQSPSALAAVSSGQDEASLNSFIGAFSKKPEFIQLANTSSSLGKFKCSSS